MKNVELFMKLFSGREDCYGVNQFCLKSPLTKEIYLEHINGVRRIGVYPIYNKDISNFLAYDIDIEDFNIALSIKEKAENLNLKINLERSKSKGYHGWCFFDAPVEAVKVRIVFESILEELGIKCELFPKQDEVLDNQFGNFIFLPLFGGDVKNGRTVFVNSKNEVVIDNIKDVEKLKVSSAKTLDAIIFLRKLIRKKTIIAETPEERKAYSKELPCIEKIKQGVAKGHRDNACFRLTINYKEKGMQQSDIETLINNWNAKNKDPLPGKDLTKIINSVFKGNYKSYGCDDGIITHYCDKEKCPLTNAQARKEQIEAGIITMVFRDPEAMIFKKKNYEYRLTNFEFTKAGKFKVSLTLSKEGKIIHKDVINLSMASNRKRFVNATKDEEIDNDLIKLEDLVKKQLEKEEHDKLSAPKQLYIMTEEEKNEAIKFLENTPNLLYHIIDLTNRMGVMGEETLRLMVYLCYTSRILNEPLSMTVKGEASSGKSFSCTNVQKLIPEEGYHFITRATQNAFFHLAEDGMQHRIIYINELQGSESADYSIRTAQSEGDLILMMPIKDPQTGEMETVTKRVKGPVGFLITTTKAQMFSENETRNFSVFSDDSPKLTQAIGDITVRKAMGEVFKVEERELNLWKNIQRLLNPDFKVIIPYAKEVFSSFPDKPVRIRRDRERFRVLIEVVTLLHQFHRKQEKSKEGTIHLISTLADYFVAKTIAESVLTYTIYEIGPSAEDLWKAINAMKEHSIKEDPVQEFIFKYKDVAEYIDWKVEKVKKWVYVLLNANLLEYEEKGTAGGRGKASTFKISKRGLEWSSSTLGFLPKIEDLFSKHHCDPKTFYNPLTGSTVNPITAEAPEGLLE
jgi:hypothetical protein